MSSALEDLGAEPNEEEAATKDEGVQMDVETPDESLETPDESLLDESKEEDKEDEDLLDNLLPTKDDNFGEDEPEAEHREDISDEEDEDEEEEERTTDEPEGQDAQETAVSDISDTEDDLGQGGEEGGPKSADSDFSEVSKKGSGSEDDQDMETVDSNKAKDSEDSKENMKVEPASPKKIVEDEKTQVASGEQDQGEEDKPKRKSKNYDYATKLNYLFRDARFFLVKSNNAENVEIAKDRGVWSTPFSNETKFNKAYQESRNVLLLFSVKESGKFSGLARVSAESGRDGPKIPWILPHGLSANALGGVFKIDWICKTELTFQKVQHLYNPWNDGKPVKIGRDGQEIEPKVAEELCRLFGVDKTVDMTPILRRSKETARLLRAKEPAKKTGPLVGRLGGRPEGAHPGRGGRTGDRVRDGGRGRGRGEGRFRDRGRRRHRLDDLRGRGGGAPRGGAGARGGAAGRGAGPGGTGGGRPKMPRFDERRRPPLLRERSPLGYTHLYDSRPPSYADYLRLMAPRGPPQRAEYIYPGEQFLHPPPRYYEGPGILPIRRRSRSRSYDRSVEEFLRRTSRRSRDRSLGRRRSRSRTRSRSRSRDRAREGRRYRR